MCRNLFAAPKSADSYHDSSQPTDSAFVLEGQQDATRGAVNYLAGYGYHGTALEADLKDAPVRSY